MTIKAARDWADTSTKDELVADYLLALDVIEAYERRDKARVEMARQGGAVESGVVNEWYEAVDALSIARAALEAATE